ncbi:MAG: hypothetical protein NC086_10805 [Alistipes sp.]|nr:hypothetical protein [Alistipes sp.]
MSGRNKKIITTILLLVLAIGLVSYYINDNLPAFRSVFLKKDHSVSLNINDMNHISEQGEITSSDGEETTEGERELAGWEIEIGDIPNLYDTNDVTMDTLIFTIKDYYFTDGMPQEIPDEQRIQRESYFNRYYADEDGSAPEIKCLVVDMEAYNPNEKTVLFLWNCFSLELFDDEGQMIRGGDLEYMSDPYSMGNDMFHCVLEGSQTVSQRLYFPFLEKFMEGRQVGLLANFRGNLQWVQSGNAPVIMLDKEREQ